MNESNNLYLKRHLYLLKIFETKRKFVDKINCVYDIYFNLNDNFNAIFFQDTFNTNDKLIELIEISLKKAKELLLKIEDLNTHFVLQEKSKVICEKTKNLLKRFEMKATNFTTKKQIVNLLQNEKTNLCHHLFLEIIDYL